MEVADEFWVGGRLDVAGLSGYEPENLSTVLGLCDVLGDGAFIDVGANIGLFSVMVATTTTRPVHAIEPTPALQQAIKTITSINELDVVVAPLAFGERDGKATLYLSDTSDCSNSLAEGFRVAKQTIEVPVTSLDAYCSDNDLRPQIIKIDTETTEPQVLRGATRMLGEVRPWIICEVLEGRAGAEISEIMGGYPHYEWYRIGRSFPPEREYDLSGSQDHRFANWLFAPSTPTEALWSAIAERKRQIFSCWPSLERHDCDPPNYAAQTGVIGGASVWAGLDGATFIAEGDEPQSVEFQLDDPKKRTHLSNSGVEGRYDHVPQPAVAAWCPGHGTYTLALRVQREGEIVARLVAKRYDDDGSACGEKEFKLADGVNMLRLQPTASDREQFRFVFRFWGVGSIRLSPLRAYLSATAQ